MIKGLLTGMKKGRHELWGVQSYTIPLPGDERLVLEGQDDLTNNGSGQHTLWINASFDPLHFFSPRWGLDQQQLFHQVRVFCCHLQGHIDSGTGKG